MFPGLLTMTCDIYRNQPVGANGRSSKQLLYSAVPCQIIPMNTSTAIDNGFSLGKAYDLFFGAGQDLVVADQCIVPTGGTPGTAGTSTYTVKQVQSYQQPMIGYVHGLTEQEIS